MNNQKDKYTVNLYKVYSKKRDREMEIMVFRKIKKYREKLKLWTEYVQGFCYSEVIKQERRDTYGTSNLVYNICFKLRRVMGDLVRVVSLHKEQR